MKLFLNILALALVLTSTSAAAQVHVVKRGVHTMRSNVLPSDRLPEASATLHGIERAAGRGVLNVVVLERRDGVERTVPARVAATKHNLLGQKESIKVSPVEENGRVSYLGTFQLGPLPNQRFTVTATPAGSSESLTLDFEDRFMVRGR